MIREHLNNESQILSLSKRFNKTKVLLENKKKDKLPEPESFQPWKTLVVHLLLYYYIASRRSNDKFVPAISINFFIVMMHGWWMTAKNAWQRKINMIIGRVEKKQVVELKLYSVEFIITIAMAIIFHNYCRGAF